MSTLETEEVNLLDILAAFYAALKRNYILTFLLPLLGVGIALFYVNRARDIFESSLLIETSLLSENESQFLFDQLDRVGVIPGLSQEEDNNVNGFGFKVIRGETTPTPIERGISLNEKTLYLQVTARVYDDAVFPALERSIVDFVDKSPSVQRHRAEREKFYGGMISTIEQEIAAMDQVKKEITTKIQATYLNPSELYSKTVELLKEKTLYEIKREEIKSVHLIKGFDTLAVTRKPKMWLAGLIGFAAGFAVLCLVLFIKFFARYFKLYQKKQPAE
jgi:hypothetical protein